MGQNSAGLGYREGVQGVWNPNGGFSSGKYYPPQWRYPGIDGIGFDGMADKNGQYNGGYTAGMTPPTPVAPVAPVAPVNLDFLNPSFYKVMTPPAPAAPVAPTTTPPSGNKFTSNNYTAPSNTNGTLIGNTTYYGTPEEVAKNHALDSNINKKVTFTDKVTGKVYTDVPWQSATDENWDPAKFTKTITDAPSTPSGTSPTNPVAPNPPAIAAQPAFDPNKFYQTILSQNQSQIANMQSQWDKQNAALTGQFESFMKGITDKQTADANAAKAKQDAIDKQNAYLTISKKGINGTSGGSFAGDPGFSITGMDKTNDTGFNRIGGSFAGDPGFSIYGKNSGAQVKNSAVSRYLSKNNWSQDQVKY